MNSNQEKKKDLENLNFLFRSQLRAINYVDKPKYSVI